MKCGCHPEIDDSWVCARCNWRSFEPNTNPDCRPPQCVLRQKPKIEMFTPHPMMSAETRVGFVLHERPRSSNGRPIYDARNYPL